MRTKSVLLIAVALGLGFCVLFSGIRNYRNSTRLGTEGKATTAQVLDRTVRPGSRGTTRYCFKVQFQTDSDQTVHARVRVTKSVYRANDTAATVTLRYLPSDPAICAVGEPFPVWRGQFISSALLVLSGGVLLGLSRGRFSTRQAAVKVAESVGALCETHYEYVAVRATEFAHLDLAWYDASQRWLEEQGFALLGDEENLTFRRTSKGNRTLLRTMLARDGTCLAYLYHFKPASPMRALGGDGFRILELQTQFTNGAFLTTSNAEAAGKLDSPPGVDALRLPAQTSLDAIFAAHGQRVSASLTTNPGVAAVRLSSLEDVHRSQNVLQQIKAAFRKNAGISKEELQRLAGNRLGPEQIEALHADVQKIHGERNQTAA